MSYIINNSRGQIVAVVADGTTNSTATDLTLVGRAVTNFGEFQNENYVFLLENFADSVAPSQPILGQLWYNSSTDVISTYSTTNNWVALATQDYVQATKVSPAFTGTPTAPTAAAGTSTTQLATTAFVTSSPQFSGVPTAPTATSSTSTTQLATTAFVQNRLSSASGFSSAGTISAAGFSTTGSVSATGFSTTGSVSATGDILGGNITANGNVFSTGQLSITGNITGNNINSVGQIVASVITASGNITGGNILGGANVNATLFTGTTVSVTGNITGGNLFTAGNITANNIIADNISTSGTSAFRIPNLTQAQIAALTPLNGDLVYNTTIGYAQVYQQGGWLEITIARYS